MSIAVKSVSTRTAILDATDRLLTRYGYKKMTIDDLAQEVGIGKGSIYLHFSSKEEIALSHIDRIIERLQLKLREIADSRPTVEKRLREMLRERVMFRFDSVQHYTRSLDDLLGKIRPSLLERRRQYFADEAEIFAQVIAEGQRSKRLVKGDPLEIAHSLLIATNSLLPYSLSTDELGNRADIEKRTQKTAEILINGLGNR